MAGDASPSEQLLRLLDGLSRRVATGELDARATTEMLRRLGAGLRPRGRERRAGERRRIERRQRGESAPTERRAGCDRRRGRDRRASADRRARR